MNIIERVQAPTPKFFVKLRNISLILATLGASVLAAPVALPAILLKIAGYIAVAGTIGGTISQTVTGQEQAPLNEDTSGTAFPKR
ncbi:MAG: hypothetical protein ABIN36_03595 [Ferruginibacter sp.]